MEEEKRLDVAELQDLEKRIDVLEGQPETPLVCPIFKSDLDDMNDRITVLEGGTAPGPQNPMRLAELADFGGRVEELEEEEEEEVVDFVKDDFVAFDFSDFCTALKGALTQEELSKNIECIASGIYTMLKIVGPGVNDELDIQLTSDSEYLVESKDKTLHIEPGSPCEEGTTLNDRLTDLAKCEFEQFYEFTGTKLSLYKKPHVEIHFNDGTVKDVKLNSEVLPISAVDVSTIEFKNNTTVNLDTRFITTLKNNLPEELEELVFASLSNGGGYPAIFVLGPSTTISLVQGKPVATGTNYLGLAIDRGKEEAYLVTDFSGPVSTNWTMFSVADTFLTTDEYFTDLFNASIDGIKDITLPKDVKLFNPSKVVFAADMSGDYVLTELVLPNTESDKELIKVKAS